MDAAAPASSASAARTPRNHRLCRRMMSFAAPSSAMTSSTEAFTKGQPRVQAPPCCAATQSKIDSSRCAADKAERVCKCASSEARRSWCWRSSTAAISRCFVLKLRIQGRLRNAGPGDDGVDPTRRDAALVKQPRRRVDQFLARRGRQHLGSTCLTGLLAQVRLDGSCQAER
jgi:hypothetical protein